MSPTTLVHRYSATNFFQINVPNKPSSMPQAISGCSGLPPAFWIREGCGSNPPTRLECRGTTLDGHRLHCASCESAHNWLYSQVLGIPPRLPTEPAATQFLKVVKIYNIWSQIVFYATMFTAYGRYYWFWCLLHLCAVKYCGTIFCANCAFGGSPRHSSRELLRRKYVAATVSPPPTTLLIASHLEWKTKAYCAEKLEKRVYRQL